jgi:hypothetical protein
VGFVVGKVLEHIYVFSGFFLPVIMHQRSTFNSLSSEAGTIGLLAALVAIGLKPTPNNA